MFDLRWLDSSRRSSDLGRRAAGTCTRQGGSRQRVRREASRTSSSDARPNSATGVASTGSASGTPGDSCSGNPTDHETDGAALVVA
jgi:hypothetical protein